MIKKVFIRVLLVFMVIAFLGIVIVQWLWIENALHEREYRFSSKVYDVLSRSVYRIDQINYVDYLTKMREQLGEIQSYNELIRSLSNNSENLFSSSAYLQEFLTNDINRIKQDRSFLSVQVAPHLQRDEEKDVSQGFIIQSIESLHLNDKSSDAAPDNYTLFNEKLKTFMLRLIKEKDPRNVAISERLHHINIHHILTRYFSEQDINLSFRHEVLDRQELLKKIENEKGKFYYIPLFPNDYIDKEYYLGVTFHSIQSVVLQNMGWLFLASGFCIFGLLSVFIVTITIIMRQQKLSVIKNDFINNMTHELKTPIATISLATSAISDDKVLNDKEQLLKFNRIVKDQNNRMNEYVERILQQARLDKGEIFLNKTEVDINEMVRKAVGHFMLLVVDRGGKIDMQLEVPHFIYLADEVHIMNAICNLLDNAIKYSLGAPEILVYTKKMKGEYIIGVQDKGIGISKKDQKKVYRRFYRVHSGNVHNVKGFGLGLNYVKSIVELHNGSVRLTSKKNKGTLVEIVFKGK